MGAGGMQDAQTLQEGTHTSSRGENDDIHKYLIRQTQTAFPIHAGREARGAAPAVFGTPPPPPGGRAGTKLTLLAVPLSVHHHHCGEHHAAG